MSLSIKTALWLGVFGMACVNADPLVVAKADPDLNAPQFPSATSKVPQTGPSPESVLLFSWLPADLSWSSGIDFLTGMSGVLSEPWRFVRRQSSPETPDVDPIHLGTAKRQAKQTSTVSPTDSIFTPRFDVTNGYKAIDFDYSNWVPENEVKRFQNYVRGRQVNRDEYYDTGKARSKDFEYAYRIYLKGNMSDYLNESTAWHAEVFGNFIEQVDGIVNILGVIEDAVLKNNLFRPKNPFKRWSDQVQPSRSSGLQSTGPDYLASPAKAWKWEGDISIGGSASALDLDEVTLHLGQFRFSRQLNVEVNLFYLEEKRN